MSEHPPSVFVLIDALGWEILRDRPFLDDLLTDRQRVETILGYSSGAIPTLLTGQRPAQHGHWNLFYRSPETSPFRWTRPLMALPRGLREGRVVRRLVKEVSKRVSGYSGYFAIYNLPLDRVRYFDLCETSDIYQPGGLAPARSIFDVLGEGGVAYECFNYHRHTDAQIVDLAPVRIAQSPARVFFLYLSGFDAFLHRSVSDPRAVTERLAWYERALRRVYEAARARWGAFRMAVFSDHGMTPIRETRDLASRVESLGLDVPRDYLPVYDSTMARFWIESERARIRLTELLGGLSWGRLLPPGEVDELGLRFADRRYGDLIYVMKPGLLITPSDMGRIRFDGMHGFHPREDPNAHAVFLSNQPSASPIHHIADLLPELLRPLGLRPPESPAAP